MNSRAWADLPAHHAATQTGGAAARLPQGRGPTYWGQKEHSGAARMGGGYLSDAAFYMVRPVQEGVHALPPGANSGAYRQRPNIHPTKKGISQ